MQIRDLLSIITFMYHGEVNIAHGMSKNMIANKNGELLRIVGNLENNLNMLAKSKSALGAQLNDIKALCDNEARVRQLLLGKVNNLEHEVDGAKEALDDEAAEHENILRK